MSKNKKSSKKKTTTKTTTTIVTTTTTTVDKSLDTHYLLVLDRSGSMQSCWNSTIEGLNEQLGTIRGLDESYPEQRYFLTLVAFDNQVETIVEDMPISEVEDFDGTEFPPRGMTSLHDAMGISITNLKAKIAKKNKESDSISTALVVVMTDGHENNSKEHDSKSIKTLIDELNETDAWTFSYMGANQDAVLTASSFGISAGNSLNYASTTRGATVAYNTLTKGIKSRAAVSNMSYSASAALGDVTLDSMNVSNDSFFADVVDGDTISEDTDSTEDKDNA
jgi:uncharacterized protein YegL